MKVASASKLDPTTASELQKQKLKKACEDFETIMTTYLLKSMNETVLRAESEEFGSGRDLYEGMMVEAVAGQLSRTNGIGLAKLLYEQLAPGSGARQTTSNQSDTKATVRQEERLATIDADSGS